MSAAAGEIDDAVLGAEVPESPLAVTALTTGAGELVVELDSRIGHGLDDIAPDASFALVVPLGFRGRGQGVLIALDSLRDDPCFDRRPAPACVLRIQRGHCHRDCPIGHADRLRLSIRAAENERTRWARELHDETLQELGAFKVALESVRQAADPSAAMAALDRSIEHVDLSIRNLQGLITELRPAALDELGRGRRSRRCSSAPRPRRAWSWSRDPAGGERAAARLGPELESTVYRLVQETLTNTMKHANAERVELTLKAIGGEVRLSVSDDGSGFLLDQPAGGFGLIGMRERVELVGGRLEVESSPGGGTVVRARLPVRPPRAALLSTRRKGRRG